MGIGRVPGSQSCERLAGIVRAGGRSQRIAGEPVKSAVKSNGGSGTAGWLSGWHWLFFYIFVLMSWCALFSLILPLSEWRNIGLYGWDLFFALCAVGPAEAGFPALFTMWTLMAAAMMLPTFVPALAVYDGLRGAGAGSRTGFGGLVTGYLAVWIAFSGFMAVAQATLHAMSPPLFSGLADSRFVAAALFMAAGLYQFSPFKSACLSKCRNPLGYFMSYMRGKRLDEFGIGLRMGAVCLGCCWLLMGFALIGGAMSLLWMGLATVVMTVEKLPAVGRFVSAPVGVVLVAAAVLVTLAGFPA